MTPSVPPGADPATVFRQWPTDPLTAGILVLVGWLYTAGLVRARRSGRPLPPSCAPSFLGGLGAIALALLSPLEVYAEASFPVHMVQHLLLTLVAPPLIALGAPITLALRAGSPQARGLVARVLRGRAARVLSQPVVGWALFASVPFVLHLSPLFDLGLRSQPVHALEHALWFGVALIFWWPIVGRDPAPHAPGHPARLLAVFLAMPAMSFLSLAIYRSRRLIAPAYAALPAPWGPDSLGAQRSGAVIMWLAGSLAMIVALLLVAVAWKHHEDARQRRVEERLDATPVDR